MSARAQYAYLLLQLGAGINSGDREQVVTDAMSEAGANLGISMWSWPVYDAGHRRSCAEQRIFFGAPDQRRDDEFATRLTEGILLLAELFYGPLFEMTNEHLALPFRSARLRKNAGIMANTLRKEIEAAVGNSHLPFLHQMIHSHNTIPDHVVALAIKTVPTLHRNPRIRLAAAFLSHAQHDFYVYPGQLREAIHDGDWIPTRATELARWESAYQNSYKSVEAIIGDPPRNDQRFRARLTEQGLDPDEEVGYKRKQSIATVIREMNGIRDARAAHGSTPNRGIRLYQMVEFQECSRYVLQATLEKYHGKQLYHSPTKACRATK